MQATDLRFTIENVLAVLPDAKREGNHYKACCPAHSDRRPSLQVSRGRDGFALVKCWVCSDQTRVFTAVLDRINQQMGNPEFRPVPVDIEPEEATEFDGAAAQQEVAAYHSKLLDLDWDIFDDGVLNPALAFLRGRGISEPIIEQLNLGYANEGNALVLPTYWKGNLVGIKYRNLDQEPKFKWWQRKGSAQDLVMHADLPRVDTKCSAIALLEAPLDSALVRSLGFNAATLISANFQASERFLEGVEILKEYDRVLLIGDSDAAGIAAMDRMAELIGHGRCLRRPVPKANGKDIGEYFAGDASAATEWLRAAFREAEQKPSPNEELTGRIRHTLTGALTLLENPQTDPLALLPTLKTELSRIAPPDASFPAPLGEYALQGIVGEFVRTALPFTEASPDALVVQFLAAMGNCLGQQVFAHFGADKHYPALYVLVVGSTASGKGQSLGAVRTLARLVDPTWETHRWKSSAASGEGLVRMASENNEDGRMFLTLEEMSTLLRSMNREGSNLSGYLRIAYDRKPLENQKAKGAIIATDYLLSAVGHITPAELVETIGGVDFYNGAINRFIWCAANKSKTLPRMTKAPDFAQIASRIRKVLALPAAGAVDFSPSAGKVWDDWVYSIPEADGKLEAACERSKANALRIALIYAALDEQRLDPFSGPLEIADNHVRAAIEVVTRSRASIAWFLNQPMKADGRAGYEDIVKLRAFVNQQGGRITGSQLSKLFSHKSGTERNEIASRAGLKLRTGTRSDKGGRAPDEWTW